MVVRFFFNDTATTEIYTLSLHDALPISCRLYMFEFGLHYRNLKQHLFDYNYRDKQCFDRQLIFLLFGLVGKQVRKRSEEHTSELQSRQYLVCRLLLEKKITNSSCRYSSA